MHKLVFLFLKCVCSSLEHNFFKIIYLFIFILIARQKERSFICRVTPEMPTIARAGLGGKARSLEVQVGSPTGVVGTQLLEPVSRKLAAEVEWLGLD